MSPPHHLAPIHRPPRCGLGHQLAEMIPFPQQRLFIRQARKHNRPGHRRLSLRSPPLMTFHHAHRLRLNLLRTTHHRSSPLLPQREITRLHTRIRMALHLALQNIPYHPPAHPNQTTQTISTLAPFLGTLLPTTRRYFPAERPLPALHWSLVHALHPRHLPSKMRKILTFPRSRVRHRQSLNNDHLMCHPHPYFLPRLQKGNLGMNIRTSTSTTTSQISNLD